MASTSAAKQSPATKNYPNWLELPDELMANILQRLDTVEILKGPRKVCTTWRRICNDPTMWKVIVIHKSSDECDTDRILEQLTKLAVDLSSGELIDISINGFGSDDLLDHIVLRSSKLKCLCLRRCLGVTSSGLSQAIKRVPQLESLQVYSTSIKAEDIIAIGRNYPQLRLFISTKRFSRRERR